MQRYIVRKTTTPPSLDGAFTAGPWGHAEEGVIERFHPKSSEHHPDTRFRMLHDGTHLYTRFQVRDRYVRSVQTVYQGMVCSDSCVEFFLRPRQDRGYFNFEINAGGTLLLYYIENAERVPGGYRVFQPVAESWGRQVRIVSSLPAVIDPEIAKPTTWSIGAAVPLALFEAYTGSLGMLSGQTWRGNFYKCGDKTSHPHWGHWSPISELNFHLPECFGEVIME